MKKEIQYVAGVNYDVAGLNTLAEYGPFEAFLKKYDRSKLNEQDKYGFSLLHAALYGHKWDIAEFLINEGIDINLMILLKQSQRQNCYWRTERTSISKIKKAARF